MATHLDMRMGKVNTDAMVESIVPNETVMVASPGKNGRVLDAAAFDAAFAAALFPAVVSVVKPVVTSTLQRERSQLRDRRRCGSTSSQNQSPQRVGG